jgi:tRNA-binding EMAP/Myf-like protein
MSCIVHDGRKLPARRDLPAAQYPLPGEAAPTPQAATPAATPAQAPAKAPAKAPEAPAAQAAPAKAKPEKVKAEKPKEEAAAPVDEISMLPPCCSPLLTGPVDVGRVDFRVGLIVKAERHPDAEKLYVEEGCAAFGLFLC